MRQVIFQMSDVDKINYINCNEYDTNTESYNNILWTAKCKDYIICSACGNFVWALIEDINIKENIDKEYRTKSSKHFTSDNFCVEYFENKNYALIYNTSHLACYKLNHPIETVSTMPYCSSFLIHYNTKILLEEFLYFISRKYTKIKSIKDIETITNILSAFSTYSNIRANAKMKYIKTNRIFYQMSFYNQIMEYIEEDK